MKQTTIRISDKIKVVIRERKWGVHAAVYENGEKVRGAYFADRDGESHKSFILRYFGLPEK